MFMLGMCVWGGDWVHQDRTSPSPANFSAQNRVSQGISAVGIIFPYTQRASLFARDFDRREIILEPQENLDFRGAVKSQPQ